MIEFKDINLKFDDKTVFKNFNMSIAEGEKILLKAPSGKGKSTLIKLLLGFQKPNTGEILFNNHKLSKDTVHYFRENIGYVSQDIDFQNKNVWELMSEVFSFKVNKNMNFSKEKVLNLFTYFNLSFELLKKDINQLSGGERQRLGLVVCILLDRPVWILDEVTSGLDETLKAKVVQYILKQNKTIILVSHDSIWTNNNVIRLEEW